MTEVDHFNIGIYVGQGFIDNKNSRNDRNRINNVSTALTPLVSFWAHIRRIILCKQIYFIWEAIKLRTLVASHTIFLIHPFNSSTLSLNNPLKSLLLTLVDIAARVQTQCAGGQQDGGRGHHQRARWEEQELVSHMFIKHLLQARGTPADRVTSSTATAIVR